MSSEARLARLGLLHLEDHHLLLARALDIKDPDLRQRFAESTRRLSHEELNRREAELLREQGVNLSAAAISKGWTPLHLAMAYGSVEDAPDLLARGVRLQQADGLGNQIIHHATLAGNTLIIPFLLEQGADVNAPGQYGCTPLHYAAYKGYVDTAACLLNHGADISAECSWYGKRPLGQAARMGKDAVAELLLIRGADPNDRDAFDYADQSSQVNHDDEYGFAQDIARGAYRVAKLMAERGGNEIKVAFAAWH